MRTWYGNQFPDPLQRATSGGFWQHDVLTRQRLNGWKYYSQWLALKQRERCIMRGYWRPDESKHTSELCRCRRKVRLRRNLQNALDEAGNPPRNLLEMPSVLHWQAETGRHRRPR